MPRPLSDAVVVITGASSGIGRAAALKFASRGASLVCSARDVGGLHGLIEDCERRGAEALAVGADVADQAAVERLAERAVERFGRIDVWVNNAGVMAYGRFEQIPEEIFRRVLDTNLFGQVHGARAVLPRFREQGGGVLINLSSVWGRVTAPYVSPYVISKHGVRAFAECLRNELVAEEDIHVTTMLPQAVDTPIFDHAANHTGHPVRPVPPLFDPEAIAEGIVSCAESPKREVTWGRSGRALELLHTALPRLYDRIAPRMFTRGSFSRAEAPQSSGNVFEPRPGDPTGGWRERRRPTLRRALLAAIGGALEGLVWRRGSGIG